jgi:hypothetical protein
MNTTTTRRNRLGPPPWWLQQPASAVRLVATRTWARTRRTRTIPGWLLLAAITITTTAATATAAAIFVTTAALIATPVHANRYWRARRTRRHTSHTQRTQPPTPRTRHWPKHRQAVSAAIHELLSHYRTPVDLPEPVTGYAGRYEAVILWRDNIETFAAYITKTNHNGQLEAVWLGTHPAQYPTIDSLSEALTNYGISLDPATLNLARSYQNDIWTTIGSCRITGTKTPDGTHHLAITTPNGQTTPIAPAPERDQRSTPFGGGAAVWTGASLGE